MDKHVALQALMEVKLRDLYSVEKIIEGHLKEMLDVATDNELRTAVENHEKETKEQIKRLEKIFDILAIDPTNNTIKHAHGLLEKGKEALKGLLHFSFNEENKSVKALVETNKQLIEQFKDANIVDFMLASQAQTIEQIEILSYTFAVNLIEKLNQPEVVKLLQVSLEEEKKAFEMMEKIAQEQTSASFASTSS